MSSKLESIRERFEALHSLYVDVSRRGMQKFLKLLPDCRQLYQEVADELRAVERQIADGTLTSMARESLLQLQARLSPLVNSGQHLRGKLIDSCQDAGLRERLAVLNRERNENRSRTKDLEAELVELGRRLETGRKNLEALGIDESGGVLEKVGRAVLKMVDDASQRQLDKDIARARRDVSDIKSETERVRDLLTDATERRGEIEADLEACRLAMCEA